MESIQVSATSPVSAVAGAITSVILEYRQAEVQAVGAEAVDQAMQALALATCSLKKDGIFVTFVPEFSKVVVNNKVRNGIKIVVKLSSGSRVSSTRLSLNPTGAELPRV